MSRRVIAVVAALLMLPVLGFDAPREYDDATVQGSQLEGVWQFETIEYDGQKFPNASHLIFHKGQWKWEESNPTLSGTFKAKAGKMPGCVDLTTTSFPSANPTMKAIYRIDGDTLRMANGPRAIDRPSGFDTKNSPGVAVWTLKRVK
jgi:uncharacterized protein (TIGR03067 family)